MERTEMEDERTSYDGDNRTLIVHTTHEGIIMDAFENDEDGNSILVGTIGMMADEWFERIAESR